MDLKTQARLRVALSPGQIGEAIRVHPLVRESADPFPYPPPPRGAPLLLFGVGRRELQLRRYSGPRDDPSPVVRMRMERVPRGTRINVVVEERPRVAALVTAASTVATVVSCQLAFVHPMAVGAVAASALGLAWVQRRDQPSLNSFGAPLMQLFSDVLAPHTLPERGSEDPYRPSLEAVKS